MGIFDSLSTQPKEKRWQCMFREDDKFWFRPLELKDTFLVERGKLKEIVRGWKHLYGNQYSCPGYKQAHIPPCEVTFCHPRDALFEVYPGTVPSKDRPDSGRRLGSNSSIAQQTARVLEIRRWCVEIGNQVLHRIAAKKSKQPAMDQIIKYLGIGFVIELFIILALIGMRGGIKVG